jgi:hypothetical protein
MLAPLKAKRATPVALLTLTGAARGAEREVSDGGRGANCHAQASRVRGWAVLGCGAVLGLGILRQPKHEAQCQR